MKHGLVYALVGYFDNFLTYKRWNSEHLKSFKNVI